MSQPLVTPPGTSPAEVLDISPEALEVANCYLQHQNLEKVIAELDLPAQVVTQILAKREVKAYIDYVFNNLGFNNRFKMRAALDAIMAKKFQDMDEAGVGSGKDIVEIMTLSHKFTMEHLAAQTKLEEAKAAATKTQTNIQVNDNAGSNYQALLERLITGN